MSLPPICAEPHLVWPQVTCRLPAGNHQEHFGGYGDEACSWSNANYVKPPPEETLTGPARTKANLLAMARRLREVQ